MGVTGLQKPSCQKYNYHLNVIMYTWGKFVHACYWRSVLQCAGGGCNIRRTLGLKRQRKHYVVKLFAAWEFCSTENVVSVHSKSTAQCDYKPLPLWQVERQMLFHASNLWSSMCTQAHTHTQSNTHTTQNETSKRLTWKGHLVRELTTISADKRHRRVKWRQKGCEKPRTGGWRLESDNWAISAASWVFTCIWAQTQTSLHTHTDLCTALHMHGWMYAMNAECGATQSSVAQITMSCGSITIREEVSALCCGGPHSCRLK